jgi:hypothetical protein
MSPQDARRLVGRPDIVGELREAIREGAGSLAEDCIAEIDRLRTALRAVRACTDPKWQAQLRETP